ncbi:MAG: ABC transporter ATP-binding protein [Chloroflexi bacterium HGW-Chloroflexi-6]|nr:MAG: ABC transporter ATP-binding protein [Chloroflexi bacterium HGW-Chloroflexi-6]
MTEPIIEVSNLERTFGVNRAVDGITFRVEQGEVFGLLGPNGAGKTTSVRLLNGILPSSGGTMRVFGFDPATQGEQVRRKTGVLTETPALYERLSARENLRFFGTLAEIPEANLPRRVDEMLAFFDLSARGNDRVETFSKGMKQRLALARALIHQPPLLFLDEPTSGLDPEAAQQVNDLIASLSRRNGQTVVLATHNLLDAQRLCDRVAILNKGRILAIGSLVELSRKLWPVRWVDVTFYGAPAADLSAKVQALRGVRQVTGENESLAIQVEADEVIPEVVSALVQEKASILKVNPRDYTLEDIYFALQAGEV